MIPLKNQTSALTVNIQKSTNNPISYKKKKSFKKRYKYLIGKLVG